MCEEVAKKALDGGKKAGWSGKFTFLSQIISQEDYGYQEKYAKWWYYEYDLNGQYFFVFMKIDHDR